MLDAFKTSGTSPPTRYEGICECGNHAWARLTRGYVVLVDADDAGIIENRNFYTQAGGKRGRGLYAASGSKGNRLRLHREILGSRPGEETDFANNNTLDCRRANMKRCTHVEASRDRRGIVKSSSRFRGVYPSRTSSWHAALKGFYCGSFPATPEGEIAAAKAYDAKAREIYGEFAALNFPGPGERSALTSEN